MEERALHDEGVTRTDRHLSWDGCFNARDLGDLPTADGGRTRPGAVVRSDSVHSLTAAGWAALEAHGVRTVVDLRNDNELARDVADRPPGLTTIRVPIDDAADTAFWQALWDDGLDGSPLYFRPFLARKAQRCAAAVAAVADAAPGGVLVHCVGGRDRTGLVSMLLLALVGVDPDHIADDYELSRHRLAPAWSAWGVPDQQPEIDAALARHGTSARDALLGTLVDVDIEELLRKAGLSGEHVSALHARLVEPPVT